MDSTTNLIPLLEAAKKFLIFTPWEAQPEQLSGSALSLLHPPPSSVRHTAGSSRAAECTAATVMCQLLDLQHLHGVVATAAAKAASAAATTPTSANPLPHTQPSIEAEVLSCAVQRYTSLLRRCEATVQALCALPSTSPGSTDATAAGDLLCRGDAMDVFFVLILCVASTLCLQYTQQRQRQQLHSSCASHTAATSVRQSEFVSSSRDTSENGARTASGRNSVDSALPAPLSVYAAIRSHYGVPNTTGVSVPEVAQGRCRRALQRMLPLLERRLPPGDLWRDPSLLAAVDVMARGVWQAQCCVHALSNAAKAEKGAVLRRCPLCYAAALNNDLAIEALMQLNHYYALYHGDDCGRDAAATSTAAAGGEEGDEGQCVFVKTQEGLDTPARGWVAACRIALWNHRSAALACLTSSRTPPWLCGDVSGGAMRFQWPRTSVAASLRMLWGQWWRAEVHLAASTVHNSSAQDSRQLIAVVVRDAAARLRSCRLFLRSFIYYQPLLPESFVKTEGQRAARGPRRALLMWLLALPLDVPHEAASTTHMRNDDNNCENSGTGTLFHWLSAHGDVALMRLLFLVLSKRTDAAKVQTILNFSDGCNAPWKDEQQSHFDKAQPRTGDAASQENPRFGSNTTVVPEAPHVVQLGSRRDADAGPRYSGNLNLSTSASELHQGKSHDDDGRLVCGAPLLRLLRLADADGLTALDVACQRGHAHVARLLLEAGLSPNAMHVGAWPTAAHSLPLPLLRLLYDPSVLDGPSTFAPPNAAGGSARPSLADRLRATRCPAGASRVLAQLSLRLWLEKVQQLRCPVLSLPQVDHQLDATKGIPPRAAQEKSEANAETGVPLKEWCTAYAECQAAQDRVLRPAFAALAYDAHEPVARLVILRVLMCKLQDWLTTVPPHLRSATGPSSVSYTIARNEETTATTTNTTTLDRNSMSATTRDFSFREARQQLTVALRMYTQLTCPLARQLLRRAVDARVALCAAVEAREAQAVSTLKAAAAIADTENKTKNEDNDEEGHNAETQGREETAEKSGSDAEAPLPLSDATKTRRELQQLYADVVREAALLDSRLAAEQQRLITETTNAQQRRDDGQGTAGRQGEAVDDAAAGAATVLRGLRPPSERGKHASTTTAAGLTTQNGNAAASADDVPTYVLVVFPTSAALHHARRAGCAAAHIDADLSAAAATAPLPSLTGCDLVEPTLWCPTQSPRCAWLLLPRHLDLDALLRTHDGGGYGVVAQDMPLHAPVQRGDLVTFQHVRASRRTGAPLFVAQTIYSERRTLPYLLCKPGGSPPPTISGARLPASLVLPYPRISLPDDDNSLVASTEHRDAEPRSSRHHPSTEAITSTATTITTRNVTLHACCVPAVYLESCAGGVADNSEDGDGGPQHPLDWLQARPATLFASDSASDVLAVLRTNKRYVVRWSQMVFAGVQPCWLAAIATDKTQTLTNPRSNITDVHGATPDGELVLRNLFRTDDRGESGRVESAESTGKHAGGCFDEVDANFCRDAASSKVCLSVRLSKRGDYNGVPVRGGTVREWPSRVDEAVGSACADVVVGISL